MPDLGVRWLIYGLFMDKLQLESILNRLIELQDRFLLAKNIRKKRMRDKVIYECRRDIANYAEFLPLELQDIFNRQVGPNALNYQHADDIDLCINIVRNLIKGLPNNQ